MKCLEDGFATTTQFYPFPREPWHRIRSTNGLERLHGEIKRRPRAVGAFPDRASALWLVTAGALQVHSQVGRWTKAAVEAPEVTAPMRVEARQVPRHGRRAAGYRGPGPFVNVSWSVGRTS